MGPVVIDTNLLLLLIVGTCDRQYIRLHKNLSEYHDGDFDILVEAVGLFSDIVLLPHIMAEVSSLARQVKNPARSRIQTKLGQFVEATGEVYMPSVNGVRHGAFDSFGLTDAVILDFCGSGAPGAETWLLTADGRLAIEAEMSGLNVLNFMHLR